MSDMNAEWIKKRKEFLNDIKNFSSKEDSLTKMVQINYMNNALQESSVGFSNWIGNWITLELRKKINVETFKIPELAEEELNKFHDSMKDISSKLLELDIVITSNVSKKIGKKKSLLPKELKEVLLYGKDENSRMVV